MMAKGRIMPKYNSQLTKSEWRRFFMLMGNIIHSDVKNYRDIAKEIMESALEVQEDSEPDHFEVEVWLTTFLEIFGGTVEGTPGLTLDFEAADLAAEDKIIEDEDDESRHP